MRTEHTSVWVSAGRQGVLVFSLSPFFLSSFCFFFYPFFYLYKIPLHSFLFYYLFSLLSQSTKYVLTIQLWQDRVRPGVPRAHHLLGSDWRPGLRVSPSSMSASSSYQPSNHGQLSSPLCGLVSFTSFSQSSEGLLSVWHCAGYLWSSGDRERWVNTMIWCDKCFGGQRTSAVGGELLKSWASWKFSLRTLPSIVKDSVWAPSNFKWIPFFFFFAFLEWH